METRIDRAIAIYQGAADWLRATDADGAFKFYLVPATGVPTHFWQTTADACSCPDAEYRGVTCKHQWAVRMHESADAERTTKVERAEVRRAERAAARQVARIEGGRRVA